MHVTVLLAVIMALAISQSLPTEPTLDISAATTVLLVAGSILIAWALMQLMTRIIMARLGRLGRTNLHGLRLPGRIDLLLRITIIVVFACQLRWLGWANVIVNDWRLANLVLIDKLCLILPFVMMQLLKWHSWYPVDRFIRQYMVAGQLDQGLAARPVWSRPQYMSFHVRHGLLLILGPLLLILTFTDTVELLTMRHFPTDQSGQVSSSVWAASQAVSATGAAIIILLAPLLLRRIWLTRPLPAGPLRTRLEQFCHRLHLRYRNILLWDTHGVMANAAVMGLIPPVRYVLLSDSLLEGMPDQQIEAVFGHEAGHVKHHHIAYLVMFVLGSGSLVLLFMKIGLRSFDMLSDSGSRFSHLGHWLVYPWSAALIIGWFALFGWVSRRFEQQADVHGATAVSSETQTTGSVIAAAGADAEPQAFPDADTEAASDGSDTAAPAVDCLTLRPHGAHVMAGALRRIAMLNGISPHRRSWRHSSIAARVVCLHDLSSQAQALRRFTATVRLTKVFIVLSVVAAVLQRAAAWLANGS